MKFVFDFCFSIFFLVCLLFCGVAASNSGMIVHNPLFRSYRMYLSVVLLLCLFILCVSGAARRPLKALQLKDSSWAALSLLLLAANAFKIRPVFEFVLNPASLLLLIAASACTRSCTGGKLMQAIALAAPASLCMLLITRMYVSAAWDIPEPGLALALICVVFLLPLRSTPQAALFGAALAPFLLGFWEAGLDLYAFGYAIVEIGSPVAFDAQVSGMFLLGLLLSLPKRRKAGGKLKPARNQ